MTTLTVDLGARSYPIHIGAGVLRQAGALLAARLPAARRVVVVSNPVVAAHWLAPLRASLAAADIAAEALMIPDGEAHKSWRHRTRSALAPARARRRSVDGAGRARRRRRRRPGRLRCCDLPARDTLRADPDDAPRAGRLVGRWQDGRQPPARQEHDRRLPPAVRRADRYRMPVHAACPRVRGGSRRGHQVRRNPGARLLRLARGELRRARCTRRRRTRARDRRELPDQGGDRRRRRARVGRSCAPQLRSHVRARDRGGRRLRRMAARRGRRRRHGARGRAVAPGDRTSRRRRDRRLVRLLEDSRLPVAPPPIPAARWLELMARDKKAQAGAMRFVLLDALGRATVRSGVDEAALREVLRA